MTDGTDVVLVELMLALDLRRWRLFLNARLMRLVVVTEPEVSVSLELVELESSEELDDPFNISCRTPG